MDKIYHQKENITLWYVIVAMCIGVIIFGYTLIGYLAWQVLPLIIIGVGKIIKLNKNALQEAIALNQEGITLLNTPEQSFYKYSDIYKIKMESKLTNGHLILKESNKKIGLNSVAINLSDQREIVALVNLKLSKPV